MDNGLVSVVIPTFNRAYCIGTAIRSLQDQTYPNWEAVVVDDGSSDDTSGVIEDIRSRDPRVRYIRQPNQGVSAARNTGLDNAVGRWVSFLDSDDSWEGWKLEAQVACMSRFPDAGMVWTDMNAYDAHGNLVSRNHLRKMYSAFRRSGDHLVFSDTVPFADFCPTLAKDVEALSSAMAFKGNLFTPMIYGSLVHTSTVLMSRDRLEAVGRFERSYRTGEDYDFHLRTLRLGPVVLLDAPSIRYRVAGGGDQLTSPAHMLEMAMNGLRIRERAISAHREQIALSDEELHRILAFAHLWVAHQHFERGDYSSARPHLARSFAASSSRVRHALKLALTCAPPWIVSGLISFLRREGRAGG